METFHRKPVNFTKEIMEFQAIEWIESNETVIDPTSEQFDEDTAIDNRYTIRCFGVTEKGNSVCLTINDFTPFFYVKIPDSWDSNKVNQFIYNLVNVQGYYYGKPYFPLKKWSKNLLREKCLIQKKKDFYGFSGERQFKFVRLTFNNSEAMKKFSYCIGYHNDPENNTRIEGVNFDLNLYESNLDSILKFMHIRNIKPCGWINASAFEIQGNNSKKSRCQIEASCSWNSVSCDPENEGNAPFLQASFDIEVFSIDGTFPVPTVKENCVTQIATAFKYFGSSEFTVKHIITLKDCAPILAEEGEVPIVVESYSTEKEVLLAWKKLIVKMDPDVLYTYNGDQFDCNYLNERAKLSGCLDSFLNLGRLKDTPAVLLDKQFSSSAYGTTNYKRLSIPGRVNFDILIYIQREYKENSYKLDSIAEKYLGKNKNDMTPQNMFDFFASGDPEKIRILAEYCIMDTLLPQLLADKMHILQNQISMSNVTYVPFKYLIERGQSIKAFSQILRETRKSGYLVPCLRNNFNEKKEGEESFVGATVLSPTTGAYFEPITVCDFASLYPSIIRAHNLCFSTIVLDPKYSNLPGIEYKTLEWEDTDKETGKITKHSYQYAQSVEGILPGLLKELTDSRKKYKNLMKDAPDAFTKEIYNKCQKAVKVSMNSVYGFLAAPMLCCKPIAATVTAYGRNMIADTKKFMEDNYSATSAVYGDSLTGDTPLLLRDPETGIISIQTFEDLFVKEDTLEYPGFKAWDLERQEKEYCKSNLQSWSDLGWQNIKKVIRHKCSKNIFEVTTFGGGKVKVTEDHSLLSSSKELLKPTECHEGYTQLLTSYPSFKLNLPTNLSSSRCYLYGLFFKTGKIDQDSVVIENLQPNVIDTVLDLFEEQYTGIFSKVMQYSEETKASITFKLIEPEYLDAFYYSGKTKQIPLQVLNGDLGLAAAFLRGYNSIDAHRLIPTHSEEAGVYFLRSKLLGNQSNKSNRISKIIDLGSTIDYVFDLETEAGRFQAGVGDIIVKNTDSVFIKFKTKTTEKYNKEYDRIYSHTVVTDNDKKILKKLKVECIRESMELGKEAAKKATATLFKEPISLEYEKVYCPLLLLSKKRYIGELYSENPEKMDYLDNKGVVLTRRDNFQLLRECYQKIVDIFMEDGIKGLDKVLKYINEMIDDIKFNRINKDSLIVTKTLKGPYKSQNIPHVVLAKKIAERDPGAAPRQNDRIPYIFIDNGWLKATTPQFMKVEDPNFAKQHNLPVDTEYYIKALMNPLCEILELFMDKPDEMFKKITNDYRKERLARLKKQSK